MYRMGVTRMVLFSIIGYISFFLIGWTIFDMYIITSSIPIDYSMKEYESFLSNVFITTFFLVLTLVLSKGFAKWVTTIYGILLIWSIISTVRSLTTMEQYQILFDLDKMFIFMYAFACIFGLILIYIQKRYHKST